MPFIFGSGEPVSRLRRSLDIKGKVSLQVDETIVPVLKIFDSTEAPFRRTGVRWFTSVTFAPVVGEQPRLRIFHTLPIDQLVDRVEVFSRAGAGAQRVFIGAGPAGVAGGTAMRTTEVMPLDAGGVISRQIPILFFADTVVAPTLSQTFWSMAWDADSVVPGVFDLPIVIPAQPDQGDPITNAPTLTIEGDVVNQDVIISVSGLYWDSLPLDART